MSAERMHDYEETPRFTTDSLWTWTVESFSREPFRAGWVLKQLHALREMRLLLQFVLDYQAFSAAQPSEENYRTLLDGGLSQALLGVALDRRLYDPAQFESRAKVLWAFGIYLRSKVIFRSCRHISYTLLGPSMVWLSMRLDNLLWQQPITL
ncbi:uncharacterized protein PHACADRAFT_254947 [Phanerochaete carnosa HHB-10118-sp]|uniref:Uncharacterized protein n=1 Tax=Phanerochaete carnosa (strain HHB-10118-sp) TaxID=650164 RepID=K5X378_PHACS|nr:uncharacterized protein PHACADRAFT_254947 [Phanerochaete carnosa HHB-10118-sp]EKM57267.1 hypothetical protein PHACADRAFT_254947 [Phanerochaete carnosa HHB-10118-sp]